MPVSEDRDHVQGPADAPVTLVEYGDYECPYCGAAYPIIENQERLRDDDLRSYAEKLELDVGSFGRELTEHVHAARVHEDFLSGVRSGVNGTPTLFINGARHDDSYEFETLLSALRRAAA
jgi:protein-disulfide isomerase